VKSEFGFKEQFVIGYAGLHGLAQGLETVLQAAQLLTGYDDLLFVLFGDGPQKERLMGMANQAQVANIRFFPTQPTQRMRDVLSSFDIALIPLRRLDLFKGALPSKMFEAMAATLPLIVSVDGEARRLADRAQCGICIEPENPRAMADAILQLYNDPSLRESLGQNGQRYVFQHHDRSQIARQFERLLSDVYHSEPVSPQAEREPVRVSRHLPFTPVPLPPGAEAVADRASGQGEVSL
jgi:glycosyltransferase involved in cell wall biosynthesis